MNDIVQTWLDRYLLAKLGRVNEARAEFERAASLTQNGRERPTRFSQVRLCDSFNPSDGELASGVRSSVGEIPCA